MRYIQCWVGACHEAYCNCNKLHRNDFLYTRQPFKFHLNDFLNKLITLVTRTWVFLQYLEFVQNHAPTIAVPQCTTHRCVQTDPKVV